MGPGLAPIARSGKQLEWSVPVTLTKLAQTAACANFRPGFAHIRKKPPVETAAAARIAAVKYSVERERQIARYAAPA